MSDYSETIRKHRRLAILRHLEGCTDYTSNASILTDVLDGVGLPCSHSQVLTELYWLKENEFVKLQDRSGFVVVEATRAGAEIARGRARHPEIQRPRPKA